MGRPLGQRLLAEHVRAVRVPPGQQQVADLQLGPLGPVAAPRGVAEVGARVALLLLLHTCLVRTTWFMVAESDTDGDQRTDLESALARC